MHVDHECSWTRRCETELAYGDTFLSGAGVPPVVLKMAAALLGQVFSDRVSAEDEFGKDISLGVASGSSHDECFFTLAPAGIELKRAMVDAVLRLHSHYLDAVVDWSQVAPAIVDELRSDRTVRLKTSPAARRLTVRSYDANAGFLARRFAKSMQVDCSSGVARLVGT